MEAKVADLEGYHPLPVVYQLRYSILEKVKRGEDPLPDIQGRTEVKKDVLRALLSGAAPYLVSEEGTGKTKLAKSITKLLPAVPIIRGCAYHDDPYWPKSLLCPRCKGSENAKKEYGIEIVGGGKRFSRVQGNEYTNEAKLIGLKDIQAIVQGKSPSEPDVFIGTGFFKANRGILFIDELPAIRTKVQVLLHPVLEENKVIMEEYNWEYPIDLVLIATGNPEGFSHVNEIPRPLLDRLELIYMDLPDRETEKEIILEEKFKIGDNPQETPVHRLDGYPSFEDLERKVIAPWWIIELVNSAVRHGRKCRWLENRPSIRGTIRALDHTYASAELENKNVVNLNHVSDGLKLALRGRIGLTADLIDFENPRESLKKTDEVSEDLLWNALEDFDFQFDINKEKFAGELNSLFSNKGLQDIINRIYEYPELARTVEQMKNAAQDKVTDNLTAHEKKLFLQPGNVSEKLLGEYDFSALETIVNIAWHRKFITKEVISRFKETVFSPRMVSWAHPQATESSIELEETQDD